MTCSDEDLDSPSRALSKQQTLEQNRPTTARATAQKRPRRPFLLFPRRPFLLFSRSSAHTSPAVFLTPPSAQVKVKLASDDSTLLEVFSRGGRRPTTETSSQSARRSFRGKQLSRDMVTK